MISTVRITSRQEGEQVVPTSYDLKGQYYMITSDYTYGAFPLTITPDKPRPREIPMVINKNNLFIEYKYETNKNEQTSIDKQVEELVLGFWYNHPACTIKGKRHANTKIELFDIVDTADSIADSISLWHKVLSAAVAIKDMSIKELKNACYFYGVIPEHKTQEDMQVTLGSFKDGLATSEKNVDSFLKTFVDGADRKEQEYIINARKAIQYKIIEDRQDGSGTSNFYIGETFVGISFTDILANFKNDSRMYQEYIIKKIELLEPSEAETDNAEKTKDALTSRSVMKEFTDLKAEAGALKAGGFLLKTESSFHLMKEKSIDKLRAIVEVGRERQAQSLAIV